MMELRKSALRPAWFWLTVLDALQRTGMRQNQLLHIRLEDVNFEHPDRLISGLRAPGTIRNTGFLLRKTSAPDLKGSITFPLSVARRCRTSCLIYLALMAGRMKSAAIWIIRRCVRFSDDFHENAVLQSVRTGSDTPSRLT